MRLKKLLLVVTLIILLGTLTGCGTEKNHYLRNDSKPYFLENGDVCMSPGAYLDLRECVILGCPGKVY